MQLSDIQTAIQARGYGTDTAAQQIIFINRTYREVHGAKRWPFLEAQDSTLNTVSGTAGYTLPMANWRNLDAVRIQQVASNLFWNLKYMPPQEFREYENIDRDVSTPFYWTFINQTLRFYPSPDGVYNVVIDYIIEPVDLANATDVPVIPLPYHDLLVWGAIRDLAYRERDWLGRNFAEQEYQALYQKFEEEYLVRQRQTSSHVRKSGYWETNMPYPFIHDGF